MSVFKSTRGLRNRNPMNIKEFENDSTVWQGERATDDDKTFEEFETFEHGIRAGGRILDSYARRGVVTVRDIISTFAPSSENLTDSYINSVVARSHLQADQVVGRENYVPLVEAIIYHENGVQPFSTEFIENALAMA